MCDIARCRSSLLATRAHEHVRKYEAAPNLRPARPARAARVSSPLVGFLPGFFLPEASLLLLYRVVVERLIDVDPAALLDLPDHVVIQGRSRLGPQPPHATAIDEARDERQPGDEESDPA